MELFQTLYRISSIDSVGILQYLEKLFFQINSENEFLKEENEFLKRENDFLKRENHILNEQIVSCIERDISHIKIGLKKINKSKEILD